MDDILNREEVTPENMSVKGKLSQTQVVSAGPRAQVEKGPVLSAEELGKTRVVKTPDDNLISGMEQGILNSLPIEVLYPKQEEAASSEETEIPPPPKTPPPQMPKASPQPAPKASAEAKSPKKPVPSDSPKPAPAVEPEREETALKETEEKKPVGEKRFLSGFITILLILSLLAGGSGLVIGCCVFNTGIVKEVIRESDYASAAEESFMEGIRSVAVSCQADASSVDHILTEGKMAADIQLYVGSTLSGEAVEIERASVEEAFIEAIDKDYASRKLRINEEGMVTLKEVASGVGGLYEQAVAVPGIKTLAYLREHFSVILGLCVANFYALSLVFMTLLVKLRRKYRWGIAMIWYAFAASALVLGGIPLAGLLTGRYTLLAVHDSVLTQAMTIAIRKISTYMVIVGAIYAVCGIITTVIFLTRREEGEDR